MYSDTFGRFLLLLRLRFFWPENSEDFKSSVSTGSQPAGFRVDLRRLLRFSILDSQDSRTCNLLRFIFGFAFIFFLSVLKLACRFLFFSSFGTATIFGTVFLSWRRAVIKRRCSACRVLILFVNVSVEFVYPNRNHRNLRFRARLHSRASVRLPPFVARCWRSADRKRLYER